MKGKKFIIAVSFLCILSLGSGSEGYSKLPGYIDNISIQSGNLNTKVVLESTSSLSILDSFYLKEFPATIAVDIDKIQYDQKPKISPEKSSLIKNIQFEEREGNRLRLLLDIKEKVPYRIYSSQNNTIIELNQFQKAQAGYNFDPGVKSAIENQQASLVYLKDINITNSNERLDITADLTGTTIPNVFVLNNPLRLVIDLHNTLFSNKPSNYSIQKFGVKKLRAAQFQVSDPYTITRMVYDLNEPIFYSMDNRNDKLTISFYADSVLEKEKTKADLPVEKTKPEIAEKQPVKTNPDIPEPKKVQSSKKTEQAPPIQQFGRKTLADSEKKYTGSLLSLRFKDAELQAVIFYLAEHAGLNVTLDPGVTGSVNISWVDVPWDQALDLILKQNGMGYSIEGNILRVAPITVLTREREQIQKLRESQELSGTLITRTYTLSYSKASDVQALLSSKISSRGELIIDPRTNTLIITDVEDTIALLEKLIDVFDTATPQVSIEARIVEASSNFVRNLGIQWGWRGMADPFYGNQTSLQFPNSIQSDGALIPQGIVTKGIGGPLAGYGINLPAPSFSTAVGLSMANVLDTFRLDMAISALETSGTGRIISAPKVTTQNNMEAQIIQGRRIPVQTVANFTVTTRYVNAALELIATPQITAEGTIIMTIQIRNNAADFANLVNGIPPITTQSAQTTVMIPDGGTTVIGGIYRTEDSITREKVPLLHKIPILGNLFKSFARTKQNRELLIFITPRIIK